MAGFRFHETMTGTWWPVADPQAKQPLEFTLDVVASLLRYTRTRRAEASGTLSMGGVAKKVPVHGELLVDPVIGKIIRYELGFTGDDGKQRRFVGQKDVTLRDLRGSMTTLPGVITEGAGDGAKEIGHADLRFEMDGLPAFIASIRPW